jgi:hypothetical protein
MKRFLFRCAVEASPERVSAFFLDVRNLARVSPPFPRIRVAGDDGRVRIGREFVVELDFGVFRRTVRTVIAAMDGQGGFTDALSVSVMRRWVHTHRFQPNGTGTVIEDDITCEPAWWLAPAVGPLLSAMFAYRSRMLRRIFR